MASIMRKCVIRVVRLALVISCSIVGTMKICSIFFLAALCNTSWAVLPNYLPATRGHALSQDDGRNSVRESNPGHIGGRRALSPLRHPYSPL